MRAVLVQFGKTGVQLRPNTEPGAVATGSGSMFKRT
jgi:hypothetical protein